MSGSTETSDRGDAKPGPRCGTCNAVLSPWEPLDGCACVGPKRRSHAEVLYAIAASTGGPLRVRDFVRLADAQFSHVISVSSAHVTLMDHRFCWAGQGLYSLYRHGPLPGPRSLEPAARMVLTAAAAPMTLDAVDYCLRQLGYRYNPLSLRQAVNRSTVIRWRIDGLYDHPRGEAAERQLRQIVPIVPPRALSAWITVRDRLAADIETALSRRAALLDQNVAGATRFGLTWSDR